MPGLRSLRGIGDTSVKLLQKLSLETPLDLIENIPRKYDDYSHVVPIRSVIPGIVTIRGHFSNVRKRYSKKGLHITEALFSDKTGSIRIVWFNQPYRAQSLKSDEEYFLSGEFARSYKYLAITNPSCEQVSQFPLHTARLVPQYKLTKGLGAHTLRRFTKTAFDNTAISETLPAWLIGQKKLVDRRTALFSMHFPESLDALAKAKRRLGFEELYQMSLASELNKADFAKEKAQHISFDKRSVVNFVKQLPFKLTDDQRRSSWQILQDMTKGSPMNRLLEGDVGSGKTVVATIAMVNAASAGVQSAIMAPTELLATQHAETIIKLIPDKLARRVTFIKGSMTPKQKLKSKEAIKSGEALIVIGTHALIQKDILFKNLALLIIDEQHRFGVEQRKQLQSKAKLMPHVLNMTATPIPRSLTLTLYGEMDVSVLMEKPGTRQPIITNIVKPELRQKLYERLQAEIKKGRQLFVVCPVIEENEQSGRNISVEHIYELLTKWFSEYEVGMLHGKMASDEKTVIMQDFKDRRFDLLVSTTVIEVGIDIPNASVMVVEGADRFGLAQLHQLRGRVGRGEHKGYCYLITTENDSYSKRLQYLAQESNGFKLAEYDLELRGPGAIYGTMQHGALDLRVAKITDTKLIAEARKAARETIQKAENLLKYPELKARVDRLRTITNLN